MREVGDGVKEKRLIVWDSSFFSEWAREEGNQRITCRGDKGFDMPFSQTGCSSYLENALEGAEGEKVTVDWTKVATMVVMRNSKTWDMF